MHAGHPRHQSLPVCTLSCQQWRITLHTATTHMCLDVAYPLASVSARIGRAIVSFATLMKLPQSA
jgi:hypothetical protein